ncbi:hypothetical protein N7488_006298 [Penicillium malachiteum]|nr:hypothetical protein N7488_006298 [Penicillium malachiteum]
MPIFKSSQSLVMRLLLEHRSLRRGLLEFSSWRGSLDRPNEILVNAAKLVPEPIWGVFSVQVPIPTKSKQDAEERQGKELVDAALKNKVKHFVYSSVDRGGDASIDNPNPYPPFCW